MTPAVRPEATPREDATAWPFDASHEPLLKIGEVQSALSGEFPLLSLSKIRHYESIELIHPHRTSSNQRLFSTADVERLRFILREQRDHYLPLEQIRELLHQLDSGAVVDGVNPARMRVLSEVERPQPGTRLTVDEVSELTGVSVADIHEFVAAGIVAVDPRGRLTSQAPEIVRFASMLMLAGFELRHIRSIRTSAHAHAVIAAGDTGSIRDRKTTVAVERALSTIAENTNIMAQLYRALLVENVEVELR